MATTAAAALRLLRRRAPSPMLRSLFPGPHSKATAAAFLPTVSRLHVAPPLPQPYLLRRYSSKGTDGTAGTDIPGTGRMNQGIDDTTTTDDIPCACLKNGAGGSSSSPKKSSCCHEQFAKLKVELCLEKVKQDVRSMDFIY